MASSIPLPATHLPLPRPRPRRRRLTVASALAGNPARVGTVAPNGAASVAVEKTVAPAAPMVVGGLPVLYEDGYGTTSVKDYLDAAREIIKPDGGPPRWFCPVECGEPVGGAPVLFFLPGIDGVGMGLILHHRSLGKVFEVRCLHIPTHDRTPFEEISPAPPSA